MKLLNRFTSTMSGRIFAILLIGVALSASLALALADLKHSMDMDRLRQQRLVDRLVEFITYLDAAPQGLRTQMLEGGTRGMQTDHTGAQPVAQDEALSRQLQERLPVRFQVSAARTDMSACILIPDYPRPLRPAKPDVKPAECWLIRAKLADGTQLNISADTYPLPPEVGRVLDPIFLLVIALAAGLLAVPVSRIAVAPVRELGDAAAHLGRDLNADPMPDTGPGEVRTAAHAFNVMQKRLQSHVRERTQMLAAITHDLQTPITRMRLRLDKIRDPALRERFLNDIAAMQAMVREGLDLARSAESAETPAALDLDSMLESLVEDAAEAGHPIVFLYGCGRDVVARAQAVRRTLANLIDNALKYGNSAQLSASVVDGRAVVLIRDMGPGIPEDQLEAMFQPFARLDASRSRDTGGVGLGLTIARNLAEREGGALELRNHPHGGLEAMLSYPAAPRRSSSGTGKAKAAAGRLRTARVPASTKSA